MVGKRGNKGGDGGLLQRCNDILQRCSLKSLKRFLVHLLDNVLNFGFCCPQTGLAEGDQL